MKSSMQSKILKSIAVAVVSFVGSVSVVHAGTSEATAAANGPSCNAVRPFYWEIGRKWGGPIVSGQVGGAVYDRNTQIRIASASKWIFGAYVLERYDGPPRGSAGATIVSSLNMKQGHTGFKSGLCTFTNTVQGCHLIGPNNRVEQRKVGYFNYGGGDGQYAAADSGLLDLGSKDVNGLLSEVNSYLNLGGSFAYDFPAVAGGMRASAADYATFLQKLMKGAYVMSNYLGGSPVNTQCPQCSSPFGTADLHYSYYHWIEDHTGGVLPNGSPLSAGDGAFSSPGALGMYPWISANKRRYGIVSTDTSNAQDSYVCGKAIRDAYYD